MLSFDWGIIDLPNLRERLKSEHAELFEFDNNKINKYERLLANKAPTADFKNSNIEYLIKDFYLTNAIARNSKTMAECSLARNEAKD